MSDEARAFLAAVGRLPRKTFPATHGVNSLLFRLTLLLEPRLPPHLLPLLTRLHAFIVRRTFYLEKRLHLNPAFKLLLRLRVIPPGLAFIAAAASTAYAMRYLYTHALDLLTNIVGVAYPAYQSVMAIEYGNSTSSAPADMSASAHMTEDVSIDGYKGQALEKALGIMQPNLDKKQWLMYWAIYGVLTTADHWAGPILRLFPMYRIAKIGVLVWAQHGKYNGAAWLYDTFVKPLLPPPTQQSQTQAQAQTQSTPVTMVLLSRKHADRRAEAYSGGSLTAVDEISDVDTCDAESDKQDDDSDYVVSQPFSALVMPSVWDRQSA